MVFRSEGGRQDEVKSLLLVVLFFEVFDPEHCLRFAFSKTRMVRDVKPDFLGETFGIFLCPEVRHELREVAVR